MGEPFEFRFEVDLPPSANELVRPVRVGGSLRLVKTRKAADWLRGATLALKTQWRASQGARRPIAGVPLSLALTVYVARVTADASNRIKALEDVLTGVAWVDDCQVVELQAWRVVGAPAERVTGVVRVAAHVDEETQRRIARARKAGYNP